MATNEAIEKEIKDKGLTAPRVTPQSADDAILETHFFRADSGVIGEQQMKGLEDVNHSVALSFLTFCVLVLKNGFTVTGESACASPENFNEELGQKIALGKAKEKIWPLLGFRLRDKLTN